MARVTIERCLKHIGNRFDLVLTAAKRARQIMEGGEALVDRGEDRSTVTALREVEEGRVDASILEVSEYETEDFEKAFREIAQEPAPVIPSSFTSDEGEEEEEAAFDEKEAPEAGDSFPEDGEPEPQDGEEGGEDAGKAEEDEEVSGKSEEVPGTDK